MPAPASLYTPARIIPQALKDAGRLQTGSVPSGEVFADCMSRLTDIINTWQTQGIKLWLNLLQSVTLAAGVKTYVLGPAGSIVTVKPTRVLAGWYVFPTGVRYPLTTMSWDTYYSLGNTTTQGAVNSYFVEKQLANLVVHLWQVPNAQAALGRVDLQIQQQAVSPVELDDTVEFPVEWGLALRWALADDLATGMPALIMDRCERKAREYREMLEDWDVEDASVSWQPNPVTLRPSRFK